MGAEQRKEKRFQVKDEALVAFVSPSARDSSKIGKVVDISPGGMAVCCPGAGEPLRGTYRLEILYPGRTGLIEKVSGKIVYSHGSTQKACASEERRYGVQFTGLSAAQAYHVGRMIQSHTFRME